MSKDVASGVHVEVQATYPADLVENPTAGPVLESFIRKFFADYGQTNVNGAGDAGLAYSLFTHTKSSKTIVFQAD